MHRNLIFNAMYSKTKDILNVVVPGLVAVSVVTALSLSLSSCNVTRTITNESQYFQRGDTSVLIQTKTIETYDATKKQ